jgi:hypothetical protein
MQMKNGWTNGQYSVYRVTLGVYLLQRFLGLLPWGAELFSSTGVLPVGSPSPLMHLFPNIFLLCDYPRFVKLCVSAGAVFSLLFIIGKFDRAMAVLIWYLRACLYGRNPMIGNPSLPFVGWLLLALGLRSALSASGDMLIVPGDRVGEIRMNSSERDLRKIYGDANVTTIDIDLGEGFTEKGTALFGKEPRKRLEILWADKANRQNPGRIQWTGEASGWRTKAGLTLESRLSAVENWNGRPFKWAGFEWDYGGTITSWEGGQIGIGIEQGRAALSGDKDFPSSHIMMQKLNPRVYQLVLEIKQR